MNFVEFSEENRISIPVKKPRNHYVPLVRNRKAGKHVDKRKKAKYNPKHKNKE